MKRTPRLRAGTYTSYKVLDFVAKVIEEEPKRLHMDNWISMFKGKKLAYFSRRKKPECSTVCCVGGWIATVTRSGPVYGSYPILNILDISPSDRASDDFYELFTNLRRTKKQVIKRLRDIMEEHEASLKAKKVVVEASR